MLVEDIRPHRKFSQRRWILANILASSVNLVVILTVFLTVFAISVVYCDLWARYRPDPRLGPITPYPGAMMWAAGLGALSGVVAGAANGIIRSIALQRQIAKVRWWILANVAGWAVGFAAFAAFAVRICVSSIPASLVNSLHLDLELIEVVVETACATMIGAVGGFAVSMLEWLLLRRQLYRAGWWVPANIAAWMLGSAISVLGVRFGLIESGGILVGFTVGAIGAGLVNGVITGNVLAALVRRPKAVLPNQERQAA